MRVLEVAALAAESAEHRTRSGGLGYLVRAIGPIDGGEQRIGAFGRAKAGLDVAQADAHATRRLMAGRAGAAVGAELLKESIRRRHARAVGLKSGENAARIRVRLELGNDARNPSLVEDLRGKRRAHQ